MNSFEQIDNGRILRDEILQSYIRLGFVGLIFVVFANAQTLGFDSATRWQYLALSVFTLWSLGYFVYIKKFPQRFCRQRLLISALVDSAIAALLFIIVGELSALFPAVFLWLIVGYGMRYGTAYAKITMIATTVLWGCIYLFSPYWHNQPYDAMGWLAAFWLVPLYYFVLVRRLHASMADLNIALERTEQIANYDNLTQLANRSFFNVELARFVTTFDSLAVLIMDLDGFKIINDTYGHDKGDELLVCIASILKQLCSPNVIAGRLGGDEFILAIGGLNRAAIEQLCQQLLEQIETESQCIGAVTASIGISFYPDDSDDISKVKGFADLAMYQAKQQGKNCCVFYQSEIG